MAGKLTKQEKSWILYDVGNSAFVLLATALIPVYFKTLAEPGSSVVVAWGYAETVASLLLALLMPVLGSLADLERLPATLRQLAAGNGAIGSRRRSTRRSSRHAAARGLARRAAGGTHAPAGLPGSAAVARARLTRTRGNGLPVVIRCHTSRTPSS